MSRKKEEMNAFDVRALVDELQLLVDGNFDKAYQPSREEVLLRFYVPKDLDPEDLGGEGTRKDLSVLTGRWMCLTKHPRENPTQPPQFTMKLRKHVAGGRILDVRQVGFDRVVEVDVGKRDATYTLVIELFHDGNVVLVEKRDDVGEGKGVIVDSLLTQEWSHRSIRPGHPYREPPQRVNPFTLDYETFRGVLLDSDTDVVRTLAVKFNLGGTYAEEVTTRWGGAKETSVRELLESDIRAVYDALQEVLRPFREGEWDPVVVLDDEGEMGEPEADGAGRSGSKGRPVDVAPRPLAEHEDRNLDRYGSFNAALDAYFSAPLTEAARTERRDAFEEEKGRVERKLHQQEQAIARFDEQEEESQRKGDLVYAHFDTVQRILDTLLEASRDKGWDAVRERLEEGREAGNPDAERVVDLNPHAGKVTVELEDLEGDGTTRVTLDVRKNVQRNAEALYERGKKAREKRAGAKKAVQRTREQLRELEERGAELMEELEEERKDKEPTHKFWFDRFRWFLSSDHHLVVGGRDASTNDEVVKRHLESKDRYAHADVHGAPSVVVKAIDGEPPPESTLEEACLWAVSMSSAWKRGAAHGEAYWVTPPQVSQTPESGEFLPKGAFIVRGKRNHVDGPLQVAVGEVEVEGHRKVMGGPLSALETHSDAYVVLEPGPEDANQVANRLSDVFEVPVEDVQSALPPGDVRVTRVYGIPEEEVLGEE